MKSHAGCYCALYCCLTPLQRHIQISQRQPVFVDLFISDRYNNLVLVKITVSDRPKSRPLKSYIERQEGRPFTFLSSKHEQV